MYFSINELLEKRSIDLRKTRLVRHDTRALVAWRYGVGPFDHFVSFQRNGNKSPYNGTTIAIQFVPGNSNSAVFVGAHEMVDYWAAFDDPKRPPILSNPTSTYDHNETQTEGWMQ